MRFCLTFYGCTEYVIPTDDGPFLSSFKTLNYSVVVEKLHDYIQLRNYTDSLYNSSYITYTKREHSTNKDKTSIQRSLKVCVLVYLITHLSQIQHI